MEFSRSKQREHFNGIEWIEWLVEQDSQITETTNQEIDGIT